MQQLIFVFPHAIIITVFLQIAPKTQDRQEKIESKAEKAK